MQNIKSLINENKKCGICGKPYIEIPCGFGMFQKLIQVADCDCEEKELQRKEQILKDIEHKKVLRKRLKDATFPFDTLGKRLKTRTCENVEIAREYVANFRPRQKQGLYFVGSVGNAKTTLAVCIGKELIKQGYKVKFIVFSQAIRKLQSTYGTKNPLEFMEQVEKFSKYDLLIFDDFGREAYKDRTLTDVADFINYLYTNKNNIIITSNPEMVEKVKEIPDFDAMFDRFYQMTQRINFNNSSYRRATNKR